MNVWIKYGDRNQGVEGKIKDLVAEEWDDPACALLVCAVRSHGTDKDHENRNRDGNAHVCQKFFKKYLIFIPSTGQRRLFVVE